MSNIFKYPLYQQIILVIFYIYHSIIIIAFTGIFNINLDYINYLHIIITYITCFYILYQFNPLSKLKVISNFDKDIIFMCGYLLIFTTAISQLFFDNIKRAGYFGKRLSQIQELKTK
jgi:hypothetical protein